MGSSTMTSKGQITVPAQLRRLLGLRAGDRVEFRVRADGVVELVPQVGEINSLFGMLKPKVQGVSIEDMDRAIREGASAG